MTTCVCVCVLMVRFTEGGTAYYPIISCKNMKVLNRDLLVCACPCIVLVYLTVSLITEDYT